MTLGCGMILLLLLCPVQLFFYNFIIQNIPLAEVSTCILFRNDYCITVFVLIILCSLIWVPVGVWIGLRPAVAANSATHRAIFSGISS